MRERLIDIETSDGRMETFITHPEQDGPFPAVVLYMDVWGVREELYDLARRIGTVGYYCILPDLYYRQGKVRSTYINDKGERISLDRLSKEDQDKVLKPLSKLSDRMVVEDTAAIIRFLDTGREPVRPGGIGSLGYCMGGRHVVQVAVNYPERFIAGASLHGTALVSERPDSAHTKLAQVRGELYCGFAEIDEHAPLPMVAQFNELMKASPARYTHHIHMGAEHGYALPDRDVYNKQATERDWEMIFAMFHRQIPPYAR